MKNFELNEIFSIKLNSGEEIVAKIVAEDDQYVTITDPVSVAPNQQGIGLIPSMFTAERDKSVRLNTNSIAMYCVTADQVRIKYIEATTGITTSSKKIVLG